MKKAINCILPIIQLLVSGWFLLLIYISNIVSLKYFIPLFIIIVLLDCFICFFCLKAKTWKKILFEIISIIITIMIGFGIYYFSSITNFINKLDDNKYQITEYGLIALKESSSNINNYDNKRIGILKNDAIGTNLFIKCLKTKISNISTVEYENVSEIIIDLYDKKIDSIILSLPYQEILDEKMDDYKTKTQIIYKDSVKLQINDFVKSVNVKTTPFIVYISGMDSYGTVSSASRSDVNIVAVVNPKTAQILLVNIPRDYYVRLNNVGSYDKLTHAGVYGIENSSKTIEDLLNIDINYYLKINFTSLIKLIDVIGNVTVDSKYSFKAYNGMKFNQGINVLNGEQALAFSRERKTLPGGDRARGDNQKLVIEGIINKMSSPVLLTKYSSILKQLESSFITNIPQNEIKSLINFQLDKMPKWSISSISLNGYDAYDYTYTYGSRQLYVMKPDVNTINEAKNAINNLIK